MNKIKTPEKRRYSNHVKPLKNENGFFHSIFFQLLNEIRKMNIKYILARLGKIRILVEKKPAKNTRYARIPKPKVVQTRNLSG